MLKKYEDCRRRCACYADAKTGLIEHEYKGVKTRTWISIGTEYQIIRETTITILKRISTEKFEVKSYEIAA